VGLAQVAEAATSEAMRMQTDGLAQAVASFKTRTESKSRGAAA